MYITRLLAFEIILQTNIYFSSSSGKMKASTVQIYTRGGPE